MTYIYPSGRKAIVNIVPEPNPRRMVAVNDHGNTIGEDHSKAILTDAEVRLMRELREADAIFWSYRRLAEKFEISKKHAWRICQMHQRAQIVDRWVRR